MKSCFPIKSTLLATLRPIGETILKHELQEMRRDVVTSSSPGSLQRASLLFIHSAKDQAFPDTCCATAEEMWSWRHDAARQEPTV